VLLGAAVSLARTTGTGPLQSIWEEDARDVLDDALNLSTVDALFRPVAGYYVVGPRLLGELATFFPIGWSAAVLSVSSAIVTAAFALQIYVASGALLRNRLARVVVSAPLLFAPVAENILSEIYNRPVCLHFFAMYALFWLLLWTPAGAGGRAGLLTSVGFCAVSTILIVGYLPLAALRLYVRRDRLSVALVVLTLGGSALQLSALVAGVSGRATSGPRLDPVWALMTYVFWAVPSSILGFRATSPLAAIPVDLWGTVRNNLAVTIGAWLIIAAFALGAVVGAKRGWLRPNWLLALAAGGFSLWLCVFMVIANGEIAQRYLPPVELLIYSAIAALLLPAPGVDVRKAGALLAGFAVFVAAIGAVNYRWNDTFRAKAPVWTDQIAQARRACQNDPLLARVVVRGGPQPYWSIVTVPCHDLLPSLVCQEPRCIYLDPPQSMVRPAVWSGEWRYR
jgi:hypothetical protein